MIQRVILTLVVAVLATGCRFFETQTGPSENPTPQPPTSISLSGVVRAAGGSSAPVKGAVVEILDGVNKGLMMTTDNSGVYQFENVTAGNANVAASANEFSRAVAGVTISRGTTLDFVLEPPPWGARGTGSDVFDMPPWVTRVRITGERDGTGACENFIVRVANRSVVNAILGTCATGIRQYQGVHLFTGGGTVEAVAPSTAVSWSFEWVR
jgi:hypothetical protein